MKSTSKLAIAIAAGLFIGGISATASRAADLGGDCCADLEERVADLEATTVRKGNRKVSVKLYGNVTRAIMAWKNEYTDDAGNTDSDSDIYSVGVPMSSSRFGITGGAKIGGGWSAGFKMEWETHDTLASEVSENDDDGTDAEGLTLRHEVLFLKSASLGTFYMGHSSVSTDSITEIDLGGTNVIARSDMQSWNNSFSVNGSGNGTWGDLVSNLDGGRGDAVIRYDTPNFAGFVASATFGEDDYWDVALRYANEFGGTIRVAAGIGYAQLSDEDNNGGETTILSGSASAMHVPTGLFLTVAAAQLDSEDAAGVTNGDRNQWYIKGGIKQKFVSLGATVLYAEYGNYENGFANVGGAGTVATEANAWGVGIIQNIDAAAMELFAAYRSYEGNDVNGTAGTVDDFDASFSAGMVGARIKF